MDEDTRFWLNRGAKDETALQSYNGCFEKWGEIFRDDARTGVDWTELPAKRRQAEKDFIECQNAIKEHWPTIREQMRVDLPKLSPFIFTKPIKDRFETAQRFINAPAIVRQAMQEMDGLDIRDLRQMPLYDLTQTNRSKIYDRIVGGLHACYNAERELKDIIEKNKSDFAEARQKAEYEQKRTAARKAM